MNARFRACAAIAMAALTITACRGGFRINRYPDSAALFAAGMREYEKRNWGNAVLAFEKLTNDLNPRDTLLPRSYWYLANAHARQNEHLLAAQSYSRLFESFVDDTLADDAAVEAARSYRKLWRKPTLDPTYGETALAAYNTMLGLYGETSPHAATARAEVLELEQWFATKEYQTGLFYFRRKAYDSAIIYFNNILARWPHVPRARDALLRLAETYQALRYREELGETCARLRDAHASDPAVGEVCRGVRVASDTTARPASPARTPQP